MMFDASSFEDSSLWEAYTKAFKDCKVKDEDEAATAYSVDNIYDVMMTHDGKSTLKNKAIWTEYQDLCLTFSQVRVRHKIKQEKEMIVRTKQERRRIGESKVTRVITLGESIISVYHLCKIYCSGATKVDRTEKHLR